MSVFITISILVNFLSICYQDFKSRKVYLINYVLLYLLYGILTASGRLQIETYSIIINFCISVAATSMLFMYYLLIYQTEALKTIKASIGMGDLLIFPVFIFSFSPFNFILIFMISLVVSLCYFIITSFYKKQLSIPLAGIQSVVLAICIVLNFTGLFNMHTDIFPLL